MGVLLISEQKIKSFTAINKLVDSDLLKSEIQIAQDTQLQGVLGSKFYNHILSQVSATGNTFNSDETELVNTYIQPWLIQEAYQTAIPHIHIKTLNRGLEIGTSEFGNGVDLEAMKYMRSIQKQRADFYKMRLQDYLITGYGQGKFPQYDQYSTLDGMVPDKNDKYSTPIALNHTTRYGWAYRRYNDGAIPVYSDRAHYDDPCKGCM